MIIVYLLTYIFTWHMTRNHCHERTATVLHVSWYILYAARLARFWRHCDTWPLVTGHVRVTRARYICHVTIGNTTWSVTAREAWSLHLFIICCVSLHSIRFQWSSEPCFVECLHDVLYVGFLAFHPVQFTNCNITCTDLSSALEW